MCAARPNRREFLRGAVGVAVVAAAGPALSACSNGSPDSGGPASASGAASSKVALPDYVPFTKVTPDLPGTADGVDPGYLAFPKSLVALDHDGAAGGSEVVALTSGISMAPPGVGKNRFWQELNKRLDGDVKVIFPDVGANYTAKLATTLAGGDIPDYVQIMPSPFLGILPPPNLPEVLSSTFQDLTEFVSGSAIEDYPNLANISTTSWRNSVINGRIYGIPTPKGVCGNAMMVREDLRKKLGAPEEISSGEDFMALCRALSSQKDNRWASPVATPLIQYFQEMLEVPNTWAVDQGKFTSAYEVEGTKKAIGLVKQMWDEGLIFPDAYAGGPSGYKLIGTDKVGLNYNWYAQWTAAIRDYRNTNPEFDLAGIPAPKYDGGGLAPHYLDVGIQSLTAVKKSEPARVRQLLKVADWLAAPFGTEENKFLAYGIEGWDYKLEDGNPILTPNGTSEITGMALSKIATPPYKIYQAGSTPADVQKIYDYQKAVVPGGVANPTVGLTSNTELNKGAALVKALTDLQGDIIQGRKPLSAWDDGVRTWRQQGGDQIRSEYETSYEEAHA
jgi:putative aldouronate transport system substrate-binding protein